MHSSISRRKFNSSVIATAVSPFLMSRASAASEEHKTEVIKFSAYSRSATLNRAVRPFNLWGFDDYLFGTPITATLGTTLDVQVHNKLSEETTVHWHGLRTAQLMDGVAKFGSPLIKPNAITHYKVPLVDPGLYWFHSHRRSLNQVARGL
ncbi:MAG: multicopper oxidase domain-containing protein, partial [Alphaproteobacteria bacterium]